MSGWLIPNIQIRYVMKYPIQFPSHRWSPLYGCSAFCQLPHGLFSQRCFNNIVFFSRVFPWYLEQNKLLLCTIKSFLDALASLKTMFKINSLMFSRLQDFKSITDYYRVLQSVAECYRVLQSITEYHRVLQSITEYYSVLQSITEYCRVLQSIAECC